MAEKIITPKHRGSFVHLVEPKAPAEGADKVYSMVIVLPKDEPETKKFMAALKKIVDAAAKEKLGQLPKKLKRPWKDGDEEDRPEWEGCWVISAKNKIQPSIVGPDLQPVMDPEKLYSGAYYRASITAWAWSHSVGGKGVSLNLESVMWCADGEPFASRSDGAEDFADYAEDVADDDDDDDDDGDEAEFD